MSSSIEIREVTADIVWQLRYEVMYPEHSLEFVKLEDDAEATHLGLCLGEEVISVVSVFYRDEDIQFRKFCTKVAHQGKGYGTQLLGSFFEQMKQQNKYRRVWCNAREQASSFYEKFDMKKTDQTYSQYGYEYVVMECYL